MARAGDLLVVAEVRTRASDQYGGAAASVGRGKQRRIAPTAALLLQRHRELRRCRVRFDVIIVRDGSIEWLKHAFNAMESGCDAHRRSNRRFARNGSFFANARTFKVAAT